jgi:hypothetical protein
MKWFFIEYWIKAGLDFYPGPFFMLSVFYAGYLISFIQLKVYTGSIVTLEAK